MTVLPELHDGTQPVLHDKLSDLLDDPDFAAIQQRMARFNLFEAVGAVHSELRHSNFLGYVLAPNRPHGLGPKALQRVLRRILEIVPPGQRPLSTLELLVADLDDAVVHRERDSFDLLIEIGELNLIVLIENKVHSRAGDGQLRRYREILEARYPTRSRLLVYLTREGDAPDDDAYHALSYSALAATLEELLGDEDVGDATGMIVRHYVDMLRKRIVQDDQLRALALKLYERHAEALDFIFECRPKSSSLVEVVTREVEAVAGLTVDSASPSRMRFSPDQWDERLSYRIDKAKWSRTGRGILFEVKSFPDKPGRINISLIIGPGDQDYRQALHDAAKANPQLFVGLVKPMGAQFNTVYSRDLLTMEAAATIGSEAQVNNLRLAWSDFLGGTLPRLIDAILDMDERIAPR